MSCKLPPSLRYADPYSFQRQQHSKSSIDWLPGKERTRGQHKLTGAKIGPSRDSSNRGDWPVYIVGCETPRKPYNAAKTRALNLMFQPAGIYYRISHAESGHAQDNRVKAVSSLGRDDRDRDGAIGVGGEFLASDKHLWRLRAVKMTGRQVYVCRSKTRVALDPVTQTGRV